MRAHFLLSCRIISDRVLLLLLSTHTHTHIQKEKKRETRCLSRIDSRHLIFPSFFSYIFQCVFFFYLDCWLPHFLPSALFPPFTFSRFHQPLTNTQTHWWVVISKMKYTHTHKPSVVVSIPQFPLFMGSAPSRPVVQEMPSNLIGLGEEFAHIQRRQMDEEKKKLIIRKEKNAWENQMAGQFFSFSIKNLKFFT